MTTHLRDIHGDRVQRVEVRKATEEEERQYLRGEEPKNSYCRPAADADQRRLPLKEMWLCHFR